MSSHGRSVVKQKKNLQFFMDGIGLKKKLLSESSKGEDVFAPGFALVFALVFAGKKTWEKKPGSSSTLVLMAWTSFCLAKFRAVFGSRKHMAGG